MQIIQNNSDVKLFVYEYQTASVREQKSPNSKNAQTVDPLANSSSAKEVVPPAVSGDNQIPSSSNRRLEVSADSQNSSPIDEKIFQLVVSKKSKKNIDSANSNSVSDMEVPETNRKKNRVFPHQNYST